MAVCLTHHLLQSRLWRFERWSNWEMMAALGGWTCSLYQRLSCLIPGPVPLGTFITQKEQQSSFWVKTTAVLKKKLLMCITSGSRCIKPRVCRQTGCRWTSNPPVRPGQTAKPWWLQVTKRKHGFNWSPQDESHALKPCEWLPHLHLPRRRMRWWLWQGCLSWWLCTRAWRAVHLWPWQTARGA